MARQPINVGTIANDRTGDTWRSAMQKVNANETELYKGFASHFIVINQESDFPTQDASTITLDANTIFFINTPLTTGKRFIPKSNCTLQSVGLNDIFLIYTGTGIMFTSAFSWRLEDILFGCPNGTVFDSSGATTFVVLRDAVGFGIKNCGNFADGSTPVFFTAAMQGITGQGFTFTGSNLNLSVDTYNHITSSATHIAFDLGTATFDDFSMINLGFSGPSGSIGLKGLANGGNINTDLIATVRDSNLAGDAMTSLDTITENDVGWSFRDNKGLMNTRNAADAVLTTLETVTISSSGVFVDVDGGNWTSTIQDRFTTDSAGVVTYNGSVDIEVKISGFATVAKVGGGADELEVRIAKNWVSPSSGVNGSGGTTENASATSVPIEHIILLTSGDDIRMIVANNDATANIEVSIAKIIITEA